MSAWFVTATGTDIGKTLITAALCHQLRQAGRSVRAIKPIISGWEDHAPTTDTAVLLEAMGLPHTGDTITATSPWRFADPLSPNMAAAREGRTLDPDAVLAFCREAMAGPEEFLIIEGVGGVLVPLTSTYTIRDMIAALQCHLILVAGTYVGTLSHTLTALEALQHRDLTPEAIILTTSEESAATLAETQETLRHLVPESIRIIGVPRITGTAHPWKAVTDITEVLTHAR